MAEVFISYRRNDAGGHAGRLFDRLRQWFDRDALFYDLDSIESGDVFPERLEFAVKDAKVVLVVIGPDWVEELNARARLRGVDFVRLEVELALRSNALNGTPKLIPVLLGGAKPPGLGDLHETLRDDLARLPSLDVHEFHGKNTDWDHQFVRLRESIVSVPGVPAARYRPPPGTAKPFRIGDQSSSPHFRDSAGTLRRVRETLLTGSTGSSIATVALHGMGGVGKTQLALKYSLDYRDNYAGVWWFRAEDDSTLQVDARDACLEVGAAPPQGELPSVAFKQWLGDQQEPWLLVFDYVERIETVRRHLPQTGPHHVLITSRNPAWAGVARPVAVEVWSEEEGARFLAGRLSVSAVDRDLKRLSRDLGGLQLALEQAAAFLEETGAAVTNYCAGIENVGTVAPLLEEGHASTGYDRSVLATLSMAFPHLSAIPQQVLRICAYFSAEPIPERYFRQANDGLPQESATTTVAWDRAIGELRRFGLVDRVDLPSLDLLPGHTGGPSEKALVFHRLTLEVVRRVLTGDDEDGRHAQSILRAHCPLQPDNPTSWRSFATLLPHLTHLDQFRDQRWFDPNAQWQMLNMTGQYLCDAKGLSEESEQMHRRAEELARTRFGEEFPFTLTSMANRAEMLHHRDPATARLLQEHVVDVQRRTLGPEHDDTLTSIHNLATTLLEHGDLEGAVLRLEEVLEIKQRQFGEQHKSTMATMNNLAQALWRKGERQRAFALQSALALNCMRALGDGHLHTLAALNSLNTMGRERNVSLVTMRGLQERMLAVSRQTLGNEHATTLTTMEQLVATLWHQVDPGALTLQMEVVEIYARLRGEDDANTVRARDNLATLRAVYEQRLGVERLRSEREDGHPETLAAMRAFANTLRLERNLHGEITVQESIVEMERRVLGSDNLQTASSMYKLAVMLWETKEIERVGALLEQALSVQRRELGEENLDTLNTMSGLASYCLTHSDFDKARSLLEQVVTNRRRALGDEHVDTLRAMGDFAKALWNSDHAEATKWMVRAAEGMVVHADLGPENPETKETLRLLASMQNVSATTPASES